MPTSRLNWVWGINVTAQFSARIRSMPKYAHVRYPTIQIHALAPQKPAQGDICNGCGTCCMVAPCPVSSLFLGHKENTCPALIWQDDLTRYRCGMLLTPGRYCNWLPSLLTRPFIFFVRRWLALDVGCDSDVQIETDYDANAPTTIFSSGPD